MDPIRRRAARYRVHLSVRYQVGDEVVVADAENLSRGGLFVRLGRGLSRGQRVAVEIELPALGRFLVQADVTHVIDLAEADHHGRPAGAGLTIVNAPAGFDPALEAYLERLGLRSDAVVLVTDDLAARLIAAAGYQIERLEVRRRARKPTGVRAVVVPSDELGSVDHLAGSAEIIAMDDADELEGVLERLDALLGVPADETG